MKELSKEAIEALEYMSKNPKSREWIALDAFRVWYLKPYWDEDDCVGTEIVSKDFQVKEI